MQLWQVHGAMDVRWMLRDIRTLLTFVIADSLSSIASASAIFLLAERFGAIGRWRADQIVFMLAYAMVVSGLPYLFFNYNVSYISRRVGRGQWDHTLIQPNPIWMSLLTEGFSPFSAIMAVLPGLALLAWAIPRAAPPLTLGWLALLLLNLSASVIIALAFSFLWGSLAFWAPRAAEELNLSTWKLLDQLKQFPLDGLGALLTGGLLTIVPSGFLAWYPCRTLLNIDTRPAGPMVTPLAAGVTALLATWVFRRGMKQYGRTGSQRYLSFGHRR